MSSEMIKPASPIDEDEIDLIALGKTFWGGRRTVILSVLIFGILGFFIAIGTPKEFEANAVMVPSGSDSKLGSLGGLGGLAAMAGINLNAASGSDLSPSVYPKIVSSLPFQLELMKTPLTLEGHSTPVTLFDYYTTTQKPNVFLKYTLGLPGVIMKALKGEKPEISAMADSKQPLQLTSKQQAVQQILTNIVTLEVDKKEGLITLTAKMPEALAAAQLGQRALELLQHYITEFKIMKAKSSLDFIQQRYDETTKQYISAQERLASFRDRNKNVSLATVKTEEERLSSQYNLIYGVYSELAKQLESAKIQVKEDTPVFTVLEPVSIPTKKSKPNRPMILFIWIFVGGIIGTGMVFGKGFVASVKKQWNETK